MVAKVDRGRSSNGKARRPLMLISIFALLAYFLGEEAFIYSPRFARLSSRSPEDGFVGHISRRASAEEAEVVSSDAALAKLEITLKDQIKAAQEGKNPNRVRDLARLLVLAKTAEGIAVGGAAIDGTSKVRQVIAESLGDFVGKEDWTMQDVTSEIGKRTKNAVDALDDIYFEDIQRQMESAAAVAVSRFTGKEDYQFGDITTEVGKRVSAAVNEFTGKEKYEFGDLTKAAMSKGADAVKEFTGKDEYKFGDITKTAFKKIFGGDEK